MDCLNLLLDARLGRIPRKKLSSCVLVLPEGFVHFVPAGVTDRPHWIQGEAVPFVDTFEKELPQVVLVHVLPWLVRKLLPNHEVVFVKLLWEVEVEALGPMTHGPRLAGGIDNRLYEMVGRLVAEAVLWQGRVEALLVRLLQHLEPPGVPRGLAWGAEDLLGVVQRPARKMLLIFGQWGVLHAAAADREGVEVGHDWLDSRLSVGNEQRVRIHGVL
mmetsp:Transcript_124471/g.346488  ORF Transcript_124471/g.346488 Transcript_124471/m.346488 type:complete len:216 (-) Transcript_124471:1710-2357(-)